MAEPTIAKIYTDGACSGNPGPGGWGMVVYFADGRVQDVGGPAANTTNNRMELQAAIAALELYGQSGQTQPITLYTDSEYVRNGITKWISGWKKKGWKTAAGKPVMNQDLWQALDALNSSRVTWQYVKGHAGDPGNERADAIAVKCAHSQQAVGQLTIAPTAASAPATKTESTPRSASAQIDLMTEPQPELPVASVFPESSALFGLLERLQLASEIANQGYLVTTQEVSELVGLSPAAVSDRGEEWVWRNWTISRVRKEGNQNLWQLERQG
jgi:ribonuclease HI